MSTACVEPISPPSRATATHDPTLLPHANRYAERYGWAVVPVVGKRPACKWRRYTAERPTANQLRGLFSRRGLTGLAVVLGSVSDKLRVRDFDVADVYHAWAGRHPDLAASLPTAKTGRGYHVYFRADTADRLARYGDGEFRAGRGIVVLPPSAHPGGGNYEWVNAPGDVIPWVADVAGADLADEIVPPTPSDTRVPADAEGAVARVPAEVEEAIARTVPTGPGMRVSRLWSFARRLKGIPDLDRSPEALDRYIRAWHARALPAIGTKDFRETELAFFDAWTNSLIPLTDEQFSTWARAVLADPEPSWLKDVYFPQAGKRILRVAAALQERAGDSPFFLSARGAASAAGVDPTYASRMLTRLEHAGYLTLVEKGKHETGLASTWWYNAPAEAGNASP